VNAVGAGLAHDQAVSAQRESEEQLQEIHDIVMKTSPNRFNISQPVKVTGKLVVE